MENQIEALKNEIAIGQYKTRFFVLVQMGALLMVMTSIKPFIAANNIPAGLIFLLATIYDHWHGADKKQKIVLVTLIMILAAWIGANLLAGWFPHPLLTDEHIHKAVFARVIGVIGCCAVVVGAAQALKGVKLLKTVETEQ